MFYKNKKIAEKKGNKEVLPYGIGKEGKNDYIFKFIFDNECKCL